MAQETSGDSATKGGSGCVNVFALLMVLIGAPLVLGATAMVVMLFESPPEYDVRDASAEGSYEPSRVTHAVCRFDHMKELDDARCLVPVASNDDPLESFAGVRLLLLDACENMQEGLGADVVENKKPVKCEPLGDIGGIELHFKLEAVQHHFPGFKGEILTPPDADEKQETNIVIAAMFAVGIAGVAGGVSALRSGRKTASK